ncbi:MAG TPA: hypothetical protein VH143_31300 [Kofleriaceae bacterium]|nr:hypothetical protein [Kofleriaceae bacterium]
MFDDSKKTGFTKWCNKTPSFTDGPGDEQVLRCGALDTAKDAIVRFDKNTKQVLGVFVRASQQNVTRLAEDVIGGGLSSKEQEGLTGLYTFMKDGTHPRGDTNKWNGGTSELSLKLVAHASDISLDLRLRPYANDHLAPGAKSSITAYLAKWCDAHQGTVTTAPVPGDETAIRSQCQDAQEGPLAQFTTDKQNGGVLDFEIDPLTLKDFDAFVANVFTQLPHVEASADDLRAALQGGPDQLNWPHGSSAQRFAAREAFWELTAEHR